MKRIIAAALVLAIIPFAAVAQGISNPGVVGPGSATSGHIATYNGTSGQIIQDGGAPAAGTVTSVTCFGSAITTTGTCTTTGQIPGTTTNDSASVGNVGEDSGINQAYTSISNNTATNVTSATFAAGDYLVWGTICFLPNTGTVMTQGAGWITTVATPAVPIPIITATNGSATLSQLNFTGDGGSPCFGIAPSIFKLASSTPIYLAGRAQFTVSTMQVSATLSSLRVR